MLVLRRRRVRIHQADDGPTLEGFLANSFNDHYRLLQPVLWEAPDRSHSLTGEAWIPKSRVVFLETIK